jgi:signal transduction histidine kinase
LWRLGASVAVLGQFAGSVLDPHAQESRLAAWHSPLGLPEHAQWAAGAISAVSVLCGAFAIIASVYGLVRRWRTGNDVVRQRVVLLVLGVVPPLAVIAVVVGATTVPGWLFAVALVPLPTVVGVAVLKDGIYGLRRATSRTMLWLIMSAVIAAVYALVLVLAAATQTGRHAWWPSAVAAAAVGFVMIPARDRVQRLVNRAVYGRVQEPYEVLADLGARLEGASDPGHAIETVLAEVATELGLREVAVFDTEGTFIAGSQAPSGEARSSIDLFAFGRPVGALRYRADGANLAGAEHRLLGDLSRQLGSAVDARIVRDDLDRVRERLSYAREEERRRLRRDLHDGIGAAIAGLTLKAETTRRVLPHDPAQGAATLNELCSGIRDLMAEVRRVVDGLRPPALDELGLGAAVRQAVEPLAFEAGIALDVVAEELTALPAATEIAVYRIAVEAVTNVVRHARASRCCVEIHTDPTSVTLTVRDDGRGLGRPSGGHGLATMRERAMELGGVLTLADHDGVTVRTCIPVAHPPGGGA